MIAINIAEFYHRAGKGLAYGLAKDSVKHDSKTAIDKTKGLMRQAEQGLIYCPVCSSQGFFNSQRELTCLGCKAVHSKQYIKGNLKRFQQEPKSKTFIRALLTKEYINGLTAQYNRNGQEYNSREKRYSAEAVSFRRKDRQLFRLLKKPFWIRCKQIEKDNTIVQDKATTSGKEAGLKQARANDLQRLKEHYDSELGTGKPIEFKV